MSHTPGPWTASCYLDTDEIGIVSDSNEIVVGVSSRLTRTNACLIAAAPELLEALKSSLSWLTSYPGGGAMNQYEKVRAAIDKAEGKS